MLLAFLFCVYTHTIFVLHNFLFIQWYVVFTNAHEWAVPLDIYLQLPPCNLLDTYTAFRASMYQVAECVCLVIKVVSVDYYTFGVNTVMMSVCTCGFCCSECLL